MKEKFQNFWAMSRWMLWKILLVKETTVVDKDNVSFSKAINTILEEYKYYPSVLNIKKHS